MKSRTVTVICTVLNEERSVGLLLDSLLAQRRRPDEIVIVDGGSSDGTVGIIEGYVARGLHVILLKAPGCNIATGRNLAIRAAYTEIIASTDAGVRLAPDWLAELLAPFDKSDGQVDVVGGFFESDERNTFELAMGATVLPSLRDVRPSDFLPSSRSIAYTKLAWQKAGGYPEWLDYCEDLVFDFALRRAGCHIAFAPRAVAYFRPRGDLKAFFLQYFRYARGDGKAGLWSRRHAIRYATYTCGALALLAGIWYKVIWLMLCLAGVAYLWHPYQRLLPKLSGIGMSQWLEGVALVPVIRLVGDVAKMIGYPAGILWRLRKGHFGSGRR